MNQSACNSLICKEILTCVQWNEFNPNNIEQNIRLPGQHHDKETRLYYKRYRYYDPKIGIYSNQDPIGLMGGINNFTYVNGNPLGFIDPLGLDLTPAQQAAVKSAAEDWSNSNVPYVYGGTTKSGADCSGSVSSIYRQAGIDIGRMSSQGFKTSPLFTRVTGTPQVGDAGVYSGHVDIYGGNTEQDRDVWSASHTGGPPFGPANSSWYGKPIWYRYTSPGTVCSCGQ
jgi:RHS repeat-associated protein